MTDTVRGSPEVPATTGPRLELLDVLEADAADIVAAREKAALIHRTRDIRAAGDEVEQTVRSSLRARIGAAYHVGHGHIIDAQWNASHQLDVIVTDTGSSAVFRAQNGTEYLPYESVYGIGEVKATYYARDDPISSFVRSVSDTKTRLQREETPPNYFRGGLRLGTGLSSGEGRPYKNPLFSFMLFANSGDFRPEDIENLYSVTPVGDLPNVVVLLDYGVILRGSFATTDAGKLLTNVWTIPVFEHLSAEPESGRENRWTVVQFGAPGARIGPCLGFLYFALLDHLQGCILQPPSWTRYLLRGLPWDYGVILD
jgi:hypothetical protein